MRQTLPIILNDRWLGNMIAELDIDFIQQLLKMPDYSIPLKNTLVDANQLLIASTDSDLNSKSKFERPEGELTEVSTAPYIDYLQLFYIRSLAILFFITLFSIAIARYLSRLPVKPIFNLAVFTINLPQKILRNELLNPLSFKVLTAVDGEKGL